jgi:hypothetical protein
MLDRVIDGQLSEPLDMGLGSQSSREREGGWKFIPLTTVKNTDLISGNSEVTHIAVILFGICHQFN